MYFNNLIMDPWLCGVCFQAYLFGFGLVCRSKAVFSKWDSYKKLPLCMYVCICWIVKKKKKKLKLKIDAKQKYELEQKMRITFEYRK